MYEIIRTYKCPECGNLVNEISTFEDDGRMVENHAFCADDGVSNCLWGGAWPNNHRNIENCKKRELLKLH